MFKRDIVTFSLEYVDRIKLSNNAEKVTTPGKKKVYRIINTKTGKAEGDYITRSTYSPSLFSTATSL
jgi:nicotinate phosphoribosyltransferase